MNTSKLADIAEITSSIAILITLVFLVVQLQQNTEAIRAGARQAILSEDLQYIYRLSDNTDIALNQYKPDLTDKGKMQMHYTYIAFFRMREHQWLQWRNGVLDDVTWVAYRKSAGLILATGRSRTWWQRQGERQFDLDFVAHINDFIADIPISNHSLGLDAFD